jgi:hypothetical protein
MVSGLKGRFIVTRCGDGEPIRGAVVPISKRIDKKMKRQYCIRDAFKGLQKALHS